MTSLEIRAERNQSDGELWLPPPEELAKYPPEFMTVLRQIAEAHQTHKMELAKKRQEAEIKARQQELIIEKRGQVFGFSIGVVALVCATVVAWHGQQLAASVIGGGGIIGLVTAFLTRPKRN